MKPLRICAALLLAGLLASCSPAGLAGALLSGGPKVAANGQAGKTNAQTIGQTAITQPRLDHVTAAKIEQSGTSSSQVKADQVQRVTINNRVPLLYWVALILALLLDSPTRWPGEILAAFRRT